MTSPNQDFVRKTFEEERSRSAESHRKVRKRIGRFSWMLFWLGSLAFMAAMFLALYIGTTTALLLLDDVRQGWLPGKMFAFGAVFLVVFPTVAGIVTLRWLWSIRPTR